MQSAIYNESLNDFSRKYLIKGNEHLVRDFKKSPIALENEISTIGERLLVHDSITLNDIK